MEAASAQPRAKNNAVCPIALGALQEARAAAEQNAQEAFQTYLSRRRLYNAKCCKKVDVYAALRDWHKLAKVSLMIGQVIERTLSHGSKETRICNRILL